MRARRPTDAVRAGATRRPARGRFADVSDRKATGSTYTPPDLADYLAKKLVEHASVVSRTDRLRVLDPAIGDGALSVALLRALARISRARVSIVGFETNESAADTARRAIRREFPDVDLEIRERDFLADASDDCFDLAIANPPYVRTQILGAGGAADLASRFGLEGRLDLYQAFALAIVTRLVPGGCLALITSNRFLTTKGASAFRESLGAELAIARIWDLGDTKLFDATVLPAMLVGSRRLAAGPPSVAASFTSVYETKHPGNSDALGLPLGVALDRDVDVSFGSKTFRVSQGRLSIDAGSVWRMTSDGIDTWLETVARHTWTTLGALGKIRVGVKSTADKVFIRDDWSTIGNALPELLRPLLTHHVAARYRAAPAVKQILYPHLADAGRRSVADLTANPNAAAYLEAHRAVLEARPYLRAAGRRWYELWVPHDPASWSRSKLVFRDIAETPTFFVDDTGSVVNGDCYWMLAEDIDTLFLALGVTNSTFIEAFYDRRFHNKLFGGRRRFMTQYVSEFPLPDPSTPYAKEIVALARERHRARVASEAQRLEASIDALVWAAFGHAGGGARINADVGTSAR